MAILIIQVITGGSHQLCHTESSHNITETPLSSPREQCHNVSTLTQCHYKIRVDRSMNLKVLSSSSSSSSIYLDKTKDKCQGHVGTYRHHSNIHFFSERVINRWNQLDQEAVDCKFFQEQPRANQEIKDRLLHGSSGPLSLMATLDNSNQVRPHL